MSLLSPLALGAIIRRQARQPGGGDNPLQVTCQEGPKRVEYVIH